VLAYSTVGLTIAVYAAVDEFQRKKMHCHQNSTNKPKQVRQTSYKLHGHTLDNVEASRLLIVRYSAGLILSVILH
jgi:hypothetical protein